MAGGATRPKIIAAGLKFERTRLRCYACPVKISIVIPAFNEERLLGETLAQIKSAANAFLQRGWEVEFIVCDNNSTDRTAEIARAAGAAVVFEPVNQIARARNSGAAAAAGDWLVFVDADSHPRAELFSDAADAIQSGGCLAGGSTVELDEKYFVAGIITSLWNLTSRWKKFLAGAFIFCEADAFRKLGGFSNELFCGEELELSRRLKKLAVETGKHVVILHRHPLLTSARKMRLYPPWNHLWFLFRAIFDTRRAMGSRESAHMWYDGRR
jgi:glycosyltransferase involved in cell wall biosynthesis